MYKWCFWICSLNIERIFLSVTWKGIQYLTSTLRNSKNVRKRKKGNGKGRIKGRQRGRKVESGDIKRQRKRESQTDRQKGSLAVLTAVSPWAEREDADEQKRRERKKLKSRQWSRLEWKMWRESRGRMVVSSSISVLLSDCMQTRNREYK